MPESIETDRARLLDAIVDTHMFNSGLKVAIYGDPDVVEGLVRLTAEMGMEPKFALTATESKAWGEQMLALSEELGLDMEIMHKCDLHELHKRIKATPVSLLIGHSKGKFLADDEDIPLLRVGFPVEDRFGYHRRAIVGYRGAIQLVDEITNLILEKKSVVSNTVMEKEATGLYDDIPLLTTMGGGCGSGNGSCGG
jgi:nitrogenase molybdenum-iron protein beta chain